MPSSVSSKQIADFLESAEAQMSLRAFFNREDRMVQSANPDVPTKIFFPFSKDIFQTLLSTTLHLEMNGPCFDGEGNPRDGSLIPSSPSAEICLSPFQMATKLTKANYKEEALALVIHELAHYFGARESLAQQIQGLALQAFERTNEEMIRGDFYYAVNFAKIEFIGTLENELNGSVDPYEFSKSSMQVDFLFREFFEITNMDGSRLSVLNMSQFKRFKLENYRMRVLQNFVCSLAKEKRISEPCLEKIERIFEGEEYASFHRILKVVGEYLPITWGLEANELMSRPMNLEGLRQELEIQLQKIETLVKELEMESHFQLGVEKH